MTDYHALFSLKGKTALITGGTGGLGSAIARAFLQQGAQVAVCGTRPEKAAPIEELAKSLEITGGTGGLGSAIARAFLQQGAQVAVCGTRPEKAAPIEELAKSLDRPFLSLSCDLTDAESTNQMLNSIEHTFGTVDILVNSAGINRLIPAEELSLSCDLTDAESTNQMLNSIEHTFGTVDILVNSAGINRLIPAEEYDDQTFQTVMDINIASLHRITREVGKRFMIPQKQGRILNLSSVKSLIGTKQDYIAYCTSKGAVNMYTRQLACEWGKYGITCNAIAPTFVYTPINAFQLDDPVFYKTLTERIPLGRIGKEQDIASAALYLCSEAASFVTGQILCVDGGLTAMQ